MHSKNIRSSIWIPLVTLVIVLVIWQFVAGWLNVPSYVLPKPSEIFDAYAGMGGDLWRNFIVTFQEALFGLLIGSTFGFFIGLLLAESDFFKKMALPYLIATNAIPVMAIAPILILWFGNSMISKIAVSAFISFFPLALNTFKGVSRFDSYFKDLFKIYGATEYEFLVKFKLRNALPYVLTGLKLNATLAVIGAVVGEFVSADKGLGFAILQCSYNFNSARLWAYIFLTCSIGIGLYGIVYLVETLILKQIKSDQK